jgi:hypothetical protein
VLEDDDDDESEIFCGAWISLRLSSLYIGTRRAEKLAPVITWAKRARNVVIKVFAISNGDRVCDAAEFPQRTAVHTYILHSKDP